MTHNLVPRIAKFDDGKMTAACALPRTLDWNIMLPMVANANALLDKKLQSAVALHTQGQLMRAQAIYDEILREQPRHFDALHLSGVIAAVTGHPRKAADMIGRAVDISPTSAIAHNNRGAALKELGEWEPALASFDRAISLAQNYLDPWMNRGTLFKDRGRWEDAVNSYEAAIAINPMHAEAHLQCGIALCALWRWSGALDSFDRAIALRPDSAEGYANRAFPLKELGRLEEALASSDRAISLNPRLLPAHTNRAGVLLAQNLVDAALESYESAVSLDPECASSYVNRGLARLLRGDLERGWADYEWRWRDTDGCSHADKRRFAQPQWFGDVSLEGRSILLHCEQGYGDTIQFCRYATLLAARGAHVVLEVPRALAELLRSLGGVAQLVVHGEPLPHFDFYCPLLSVPLAMHTTLATIPARTPYLAPSEPRREHWRARMGRSRQRRIGLAWSGAFRPTRPELWSANERRNIPFAMLAGLVRDGADFYSLQKGEAAAAEVAAWAQSGREPPIIDWSADIEDFADTAALIAHLDLVISVDTSVAHLAGAMAKPVWILNRFDTCWRWLLERDDSPWYPTARLYRQPRAGDWDAVMERVSADLSVFCERRANSDACP